VDGSYQKTGLLHALSQLPKNPRSSLRDLRALFSAVVLLIIWRTSVLIMWHTSACGRALRNPAIVSQHRAAAFRNVAPTSGRAQTTACRCLRSFDSLSNSF
jgi:hypothetical protein